MPMGSDPLVLAGQAVTQGLHLCTWAVEKTLYHGTRVEIQAQVGPYQSGAVEETWYPAVELT